MGVKGLVYVTLLLPLETDVGISEPWIDWVIHGMGPLLLIADRVIRRPTLAVARSAPGRWLFFARGLSGLHARSGPFGGLVPVPRPTAPAHVYRHCVWVRCGARCHFGY